MRIYDSRLGRFLSVDPITQEYPELTPYQFASNRPIDGIDLDGLEFLSTHKSQQIQKFQAQIKVATTPPPIPERLISMRDANGRIRTGPESKIEGETAAFNKDYHDANLASAISSGIPASAGYLMFGKDGAYVGQALGGLIMSATGVIPERSSVLSRPQSITEPNGPAMTEGSINPTKPASRRPTPMESQSELTPRGFGLIEQPIFKSGRFQIGLKKGSSSPESFNLMTSVATEVKNFTFDANTGNFSKASIKGLVDQVIQRRTNLPKGSSQNIIIDIRGQFVPYLNQIQAKNQILTQTGTSGVSIEFKTH
jgi:hypothetical protein